MQLPNQDAPAIQIGDIVTVTLDAGQWTYQVNTETREVRLILAPIGMPFFKLVFPLPSLAFTQFYMATRSAMDKLGSLSEEDSDAELD